VGYAARLTGCAFQFASDNVEADVMEVRRLLSPGASGRPWLRYLRGYAANFARQMENYRKHITKDISTDKPAGGQVDCLCDDVRYWVASRPKHHRPRKVEAKHEQRMKLLREDGLLGDEDGDSVSVFCGAPAMSRHSA